MADEVRLQDYPGSDGGEPATVTRWAWWAANRTIDRLHDDYARLRRELEEERRRFDFIGDHCSVTWQGAQLNEIGYGAPTLRESVDKHLRRIDAAREAEGREDG